MRLREGIRRPIFCKSGFDHVLHHEFRKKGVVNEDGADFCFNGGYSSQCLRVGG